MFSNNFRAFTAVNGNSACRTAPNRTVRTNSARETAPNRIARTNSARGTTPAELREGIPHAEQPQTELREEIPHAEQPLQKMKREFRTRNGNYKKFAWNMASNIEKICETVKNIYLCKRYPEYNLFILKD